MNDIYDVLKGRLTENAVVVGVGNLDCKDDGAGVVLAEKLASCGHLEAIVAGDSPEFYLGDIGERHPRTLMFVDAVDMGSPPGSVAIVEKDQVPDGWGHTHRPPLAVIMQFLAAETGADTFLLAVQPQDISAGNGLTSNVAETVEVMSSFIREIAESGCFPN